MTERTWNQHSVKELQTFLRERGIVASKLRKASLVDLCTAAAELGVTFDPDCLHEDREEVIDSKLQTPTCKLTIPSLIKGTQDLSSLPLITIIDIYNYLVNFDEYNHTGLRDYKKMEAYGMFIDGHVQYLASHMYTEAPSFFAVNAHVKPRTKEKDPISKQGHYSAWIILTSESEKCSIFSAYCNCKGGMDGCCRHVATILFEVMEFQNDSTKKSVTSGPCLWLKRSRGQIDALPVSELKTVLSTEDRNILYPTPTNLSCIDEGVALPREQDFFDILRKTTPEACMLDTVEIREKRRAIPELDTIPPNMKIQIFLSCHTCNFDRICSQECHEELYSFLRYTEEERTRIEKQTRGQNTNTNWHKMRKGLLTSSNFKRICSSTNITKTAIALMSGSTINEDRLPMHIEYGRRNEDRARKMFLTGHKYRHKKSSVTVPGLVVSDEDPHLAASPDGILHCRECKDTLIEIKCLSSHRNFHPKTSLVMSKVCTKQESGTLTLCKKHQYFYQIQGQMAVTGIHKCILVGFTNKGIACVEVNFDQEFWAEVSTKLMHFFEAGFLPVMRAGLAY